MEKQCSRILLIDDEDPVRRVLDVALRPAGYTMYQIGNGEEALRRFQLIRPDLVLLDDVPRLGCGRHHAGPSPVLPRIADFAPRTIRSA